MPREPDLSLNEQAFVIDALKQGVRLDGRDADQYRDMELSFGEEYGTTDFRLGKTRVLTRISAAVATPAPERKSEGIFTINIELSPMASPAFDIGRPTMTEVIISRLLEKTLRRTSALDTESLCLIAGEKCLHVRADLHVVSHDGNLLDASCVSLIAALLHFRRPDVTIEGEDVTVWGPREREPLKLSILHNPYCVTFSYFNKAPGDDDRIVLVDSTLIEERIRNGQVVISTNKFGEVCQIAKYGGSSVDQVVLLGWINAAVQKVKLMDAFVQQRISEDETSRNVDDLIAELSAANDR